MCSKELNNIPKQQYHISAKQNKVFDITERKVSLPFYLLLPSCYYRMNTFLIENIYVYIILEFQKFCSNTCFKSSNFYKDQLQNSPLWMRDDFDATKVKLFDETSHT